MPGVAGSSPASTTTSDAGLQCTPRLVFLLTAHAGSAEGVGHLHQVRVHALDAGTVDVGVGHVMESISHTDTLVDRDTQPDGEHDVKRPAHVLNAKLMPAHQ